MNTTHTSIETIVKNQLGMISPFSSLGKMYSKKLFILDQSERMNDILKMKVNDYFNLVEAATGYVLAKLIAYYADNSPMKLLIQGFGSTGSSLAYFAH